MKKITLRLAVYLLVVMLNVTPAFAFDKEMPSFVESTIMKDYSARADSIIADSTKVKDSLIIIQKEHAFKFNSFNKDFAIIPFMFVPKEPETWRKCIIRVLSNPGYFFLQDLEPSVDEMPCNGIIALSFKDVNSDGNKEIITLYDFSTSGNTTMPPEAIVYTYNVKEKKFVFDEPLTQKAGSKKVRNMKDVLNNLKR